MASFLWHPVPTVDATKGINQSLTVVTRDGTKMPKTMERNCILLKIEESYKIGFTTSDQQGSKQEEPTLGREINRLNTQGRCRGLDLGGSNHRDRKC